MTTDVLTKKELSVLSEIIDTIQSELISSKALGISIPKDREKTIKAVSVKLEKAQRDVHPSRRQLSKSN